MQFITHLPGSTPLVLDSPHSGTAYPADFRHACALAVLRHRVRLAPELDIEGLSVDQVLSQLLDQVPAPRL